MKAQFTFHPERCVGCGACVMACINENGIDIDKQLPYRLLKKNEYSESGFLNITYFVYGCMHCPERLCVPVCPKSCLTADNTTGTVQLDSTACIGCRRCEKVCPYAAFQFLGGKAVKCGGCRSRLNRDRAPLCVLACPRQALTITEKNQVVLDGLTALRGEITESFRREEADHG